jgi:hypothetical protein
VFQGASNGVRFPGWNRPLASALPDPARDVLAGWVAAALQSPAGAPGSWQAAGPGPDGFIPPGTTVTSADELEDLLRSRWLEASRQPTIGDVGRFGGSPLIKVTAGGREFVLNRDTKCSAVANFIDARSQLGLIIQAAQCQ